MSKYTIRTEAETIFTDKVKMLEKSDMNITYIYVEENHILYRILNGNETELQPDALLLCNDISKMHRMLLDVSVTIQNERKKFWKHYRA